MYLSCISFCGAAANGGEKPEGREEQNGTEYRWKGFIDGISLKNTIWQVLKN